jgi:predicted nucleic acid-binding Zn ribbon protein
VFSCKNGVKGSIQKKRNNTSLPTNPQAIEPTQDKFREFDEKMHQRKQQLQTYLQMIMTIILVILLVVLSMICKNQENIESKLTDLKNELSKVLTSIEQQRKIENADLVNNLRKT